MWNCRSHRCAKFSVRLLIAETGLPKDSNVSGAGTWLLASTTPARHTQGRARIAQPRHVSKAKGA